MHKKREMVNGFPIFGAHILFLLYAIWGERTGKIEDLVGKDASTLWIVLTIQIHEEDQEAENDLYDPPAPYRLMV